jgi:hypothetical protein
VQLIVFTRQVARVARSGDHAVAMWIMSMMCVTKSFAWWTCMYSMNGADLGIEVQVDKIGELLEAKVLQVHAHVRHTMLVFGFDEVANDTLWQMINGEYLAV